MLLSMPGCGQQSGGPSPTAATQRAAATRAAKGETIVQATIKEIAKLPKPGTVPYKDATIAIHLTNVKALSGKQPARDILAYVWGMRDNRMLRAASLRPGETVTLAITPWDKVEEQYGGYNRAELDSPDALTLDAYWGELE
jgi:hypothetical protein